MRSASGVVGVSGGSPVTGVSGVVASLVSGVVASVKGTVAPANWTVASSEIAGAALSGNVVVASSVRACEASSVARQIVRGLLRST